MSKGYILVDMPEKCSQCNFWFGKATVPVEYRCMAKQRQLENLTGKPDWCPIRGLPEKKEPTQFPISPLLPWQYTEYDKGWNDCIEKMEEIDE